MRRQEERTAYEQEISKLRAAAQSASQQSTSSTNFENDAQSTQLANAIAALNNVIQTQSQLFSELRENVPTSSQAGQSQLISLTNAQNIIREFHGNEGPEKTRAWLQELVNTKTLYS